MLGVQVHAPGIASVKGDGIAFAATVLVIKGSAKGILDEFLIGGEQGFGGAGKGMGHMAEPDIVPEHVFGQLNEG